MATGLRPFQSLLRHYEMEAGTTSFITGQTAVTFPPANPQLRLISDTQDIFPKKSQDQISGIWELQDILLLWAKK